MQISSASVNSQTNVSTRFVNSENVSRFREGRVYAVLFSDGWLKVGRGRDPQSRISSHACASGMRNATVDRSVVSGVIADSRAAEAALIAFCAERGKNVHGREWFTGVDFEDVCGLFEQSFKGDDAEFLSQAKKLQSERTENMLSDIFSRVQPDSAAVTTEFEESAKWFVSLAYARILDRIYRDDMYDGWLFEVGETGMTNFGHYAALTVHRLDEGEIADLFYRASTNPGEALDQIVSSAQSMVAAFSAGELS